MLIYRIFFLDSDNLHNSRASSSLVFKFCLFANQKFQCGNIFPWNDCCITTSMCYVSTRQIKTHRFLLDISITAFFVTDPNTFQTFDRKRITRYCMIIALRRQEIMEKQNPIKGYSPKKKKNGVLQQGTMPIKNKNSSVEVFPNPISQDNTSYR